MASKSFLRNELEILTLFSWRDWSATVVLTAIMSIGSAHLMASRQLAMRNCSFGFLWVLFYIYGFNLLTQANSPEEDRINKPDRAIPSGRVTVNGALTRWALVWAGMLAVTVYRGDITWEVVVYVACTLFLTFTNAGNHWFGKNVLTMGPMCWTYLSSSQKMIDVITPEISRNIFLLAVWWSLVVTIQDFRDQEGDSKVGRQTLPLLYGDAPTRYLFSLIVVPLAFVAVYMGGLGKNGPIVLGAAHFVMAYRLLAKRDPRSDHKTYMFLTYVACLMGALSTLEALNITTPVRPVEKRLLDLISIY